MSKKNASNSNVPPVQEKTPSDRRVGLHIHRFICYAVLIFVCVLSLFPFYLLIINSTRVHADIQKGLSLIPSSHLLSNLKTILSDQNLPLLAALRNSLFIASCAAILSTYFSALTAYGIHAYEFKFKKAAYTIIMILMMIPTQVSAMGFVKQMRTMGLYDSFLPLILPSIAAPVTFFFIIQYMQSSVPLEIVEAARIDGGNEFYNFNIIILPIIKPAIAVQAIFNFVTSWNNYFLPALLLDSANKKTLPILVAQVRDMGNPLTFDMGKVYALLFVAIVPLIIMYLCLSRFIIRGIALGGVKG